jgi:hypothetical protein
VHGQKIASPASYAKKTAIHKGLLYGGIGFHRVFFTRSDIRFHDSQTGNYDFTLEKVKAKDDNNFNVGKGFDAPQYSLRIGWVFRKKDAGIEFNFDHVKYIAVQDQRLHVKGQINGTKLDKDTLLGKDFIQYEHTDGANYFMLNFIKRRVLIANNKSKLSLVCKPGAGLVIPRTDSRIMGRHRDDRYHVAGFVVGIEGSLRYEFLKYFFLEPAVKFAYARYGNVLLYGDGRARQHWFSFQAIAVAGIQLPL